MSETPSGWIKFKIGELGEVMAGRQRSPHYLDGDERPYLRVANVFDGFIDSSDVLRMKFTDKEFERYQLSVGDILLNEGQSLDLVGRPAMYEGTPPSCCFQNTLIRFRPDGKVIGKFALELFRFFLYSGKFASVASQTTSVAHLGVSRFASIDAVIPPVKEQLKIAEILSCWNDGISLVQKSIQSSKKRFDWMTFYLLFGSTRNAQFVRSNATHKLRTVCVPSDWKIGTIADYADEVSLKNTSNQDLIVLSCTKHRGLVPSLEYFGKQIFSSDISKYKIVPRNHFAYATNHIEEGSIGYQRNYDLALISPIYSVFKTRTGVDDRFLFYLLKTETYRQFFATATSASVDRRGSLRWKEFSKLPIALPSLEEQQFIADLLDHQSAELSILQMQVEQLRIQKQALMQKLLTGKIRVKV